MYILMGWGATKLNDTWRFSMEQKWEKLECVGTLPTPRDCCSVIHYVDSLILFGGRVSREKNSNEVFLLDLKSLTWTLLKTSGEKVPEMHSHSAIERNGNMYVFGGDNYVTSYSCDLLELNLSTLMWRRVECTGTIPSGRDSFAAVQTDESLWVFGGRGKEYFSDLFELRLPQLIAKMDYSSWKKLLDDEISTDIVFVVQEKTFSCHRCIVSQSSVLRNMIIQNEDNQQIVLDNISEQTFRYVLEYLYSGSVNLSESDGILLADLIVASQELELKDLENECMSQFSRIIRVDNILDILSAADQHELETLKMHCLNFFLKNNKQIIKTQNITKLEKNLMAELLRLDEPFKLDSVISSKGRNVYQHVAKLYETKEFSDITLIAKNGKKIRAHKPILIAASEYFSLMLNSEFTESNQHEIQMSNIDGNCLERVIRFIYLRETELPDDCQALIELYQVSDMLLLSELHKLVDTKLLKHITPENALDILSICLPLGIKGKLESRCKEVIKDVKKEDLMGSFLEIVLKQQKSFLKLQNEYQLEIEKMQHRHQMEISDLKTQVQQLQEQLNQVMEILKGIEN